MRQTRLNYPLVLVIAAIGSAALLLWLNRGTTFYFDEMNWFSDLSRPADLASILHPHNSHLIGTARLMFLAIAELFGPDYVVVRIIAAASVLLSSALLYVWARRRIGAAWALLPAILLLFYGSAWQHVAGPIGFTITFSIALGLAALLVLERNDRRGDVLACVFVSLSVFTYTIGLGYLVGVAILVLMRKGRWRRAWIFLVPLLLYVAWYLWSQQFDQGRTTIANAGNVASFFALSMAVVGGALSGVSIPFSRFGDGDPISKASPHFAGWIAGALLAAFVIWRIGRGGASKTIYASIGIVATYWLAGALADPIFFATQADAVRYVYPGSVGVLLVLIDAGRGIRIRGGWAIALIAVFAFSLAMNLAFLRDGATYLRSHSTTVRTQLAMLELGNGWLPGDGPRDDAGEARFEVAPTISYLASGPDRDDYLAVVAQYGSPAFNLDQIRDLPLAHREEADKALVVTYSMGLNPSDPPASRDTCQVVSAGESPVELPVGDDPIGGVYVKARGPEAVTLAVSRFADMPDAAIGQAEPGAGWFRVLIPSDPAPEPWLGKLTTGKSAVICGLS